jgi:glucose/mannose-6-phosphate isomerase
VLITHSTLDDQGSLGSVDSSGMLALVAGLGNQLRAGFESGAGVGLAARRGGGFDGVVVCGMGGSGIAADVARGLFGATAGIPIVSSKGYGLPAFAGRSTLVVAVSYSGNTDETLAAYRQACGRDATVVSISAGGELATLSATDGTAHVSVPADVPMPRAAVGYLCGATIGVLEAADVTGSIEADLSQTIASLDELAFRVGPESPVADNELKELALWVAGRTPVVWASEGLTEAAALRWKNQLNENAKVPAFCSTLPELDHNEIEGWSAGKGVSFGLIVLRHPGEHPRIADRVQASLEAISGASLPHREVWAEGTGPLEWLFSLIMKADFASIYLAVLRGVDPTPVPVLMGLKERLRP